MHADILIVLNN